MDIRQAKEELRRMVLAYTERTEDGQLRIPMLQQRPALLMGPPGVGEGGGAHGKVGEQVRVVDAEETVAPVAAAGMLVHDFNQLVPQQLGAGGEAGSRGECVETADFNQVVYIAHLGHSFRILWVAIATVIL